MDFIPTIASDDETNGIVSEQEIEKEEKEAMDPEFLFDDRAVPSAVRNIWDFTVAKAALMKNRDVGYQSIDDIIARNRKEIQKRELETDGRQNLVLNLV